VPPGSDGNGSQRAPAFAEQVQQSIDRS
jgi:hypothetical protein